MTHNNKRAFTLVELLIVIVVIGILFVVVVANVDFSTDAAKEAGVMSTFKSYQTASQVVGLQYNGFTNDINTLVKYLNKRLDSELQLYIDDGGNIKSFATDPWGTQIKVSYTEPTDTKGQLRFISAGPDTVFGNADDIITQIKCSMTNDIIIENPENNTNHTHSYTQQVATLTFKKSDANCDSPALYYLSCSCGEKGTDTFTIGDKDPNVHEVVNDTFVLLANNKHMMTRRCQSCNIVIEEVEEDHDTSAGETCPLCGGPIHVHIFEEQIQTEKHKLCDADCQHPLTYYFSCTCGETGTSTFTVGTVNYDVHIDGCTIVNANDENICKKYSICGITADANHNTGMVTCTDAQACIDCGYILANALGHTADIDDGNCTTAIYCKNGCGTIMTVAKSHIYDNDCDPICNNSGCTAGNRNITHSYTIDSGIQYTAATCTTARKNYLKCSCGHNPQDENYVVSVGDVNSSNHIHNKTEIKIEAKEICELLNRKPGKFLREIFDDLEYKLVNKLLENEKDTLKKYIIENY
jgi:prepilin-type N-terminal cleavage/methylation domain-containing protein